MRYALTVIVFGCALVLVGGMQPTAVAQESSETVQAIVEKSASFGLKRYPLGFWNYTNLGEHGEHLTEAAVAEWDEAGFNVPHSPSFDANRPEQVAQMRRLLDACQARGMKLILCDPRAHASLEEKDGKHIVRANYAEQVRAAATQFGEHPALFGLAVGDEPDAADKLGYFDCSRIQKEVAPKLHPFVNLLPHFPGAEARAGAETWPDYLDEFCQKSQADLLCYDCYAQMNPGQSGWNMYFKNLRLYREAALRNKVPFWSTLLLTGHYKYRCPNYDELRWQFNTAVASGAHGLLWFFYYQRAPEANYRMAAVDEFWERTPTYDNLRRVQKRFLRLYGDLFTRMVVTKVMFSPDPYGGGESFASDDLLVRIEPQDKPALVSEFVDVQGRRYVMLVNLSMTESEQIALTFRGKGRRYFSWNWSGQECAGAAYSSMETTQTEDGPRLGHYLAPGQEAVYRVE